MDGIKIDFNAEVNIEKMFDIHDNGTVNIYASKPEEKEPDTEEPAPNAWARCAQIITALAAEGKIKHKNDHIALMTIIKEMKILGRFVQADYLRLMGDTTMDADIVPNKQALSRFYFGGEYPNWKEDDKSPRELERLTQLATDFQTAYKQK